MRLASDFNQLYRAHYDFVWRSAKRLGVPDTVLDDVLQETFLVVYRRLPDYDGRAAVTTWLFGILYNVWRNHRRGRQRSARKHNTLEQRRAIAESTWRARTELDAQAGLAERLLDEFLAELDPRQRSVFVLAELEGMTGPEIAAALDLRVNTARSRLRAARAAFDRRFDDGGEVREFARALRQDPPRASESQRARTRALVVAGLSPVRLGGVLGLAKLLPAWVGGLGVVGATAVGVGLLAASDDPPASEAVGRTIEPTRVLEQPRSETPEVEPIEVTAAVDERQRRGAKNPAPRKPPVGYAELEAARAALIDGSPERALEFARGIDREGPLAWERAATEVAALCQLGHADAARRVAEDLVAAGSRRPIPALCWTPRERSSD